MVTTVDDLLAMSADRAVSRIVVNGEVRGLASLRLAPGQQLVGGTDDAALVFLDGADGVQLSQANEVSGLRIEVQPARRAIFNDTDVEDLGTLRLTAVRAVGQVQLLATNRVRAGNVVVNGLDIRTADLRDRVERPELLGVGVLQGAFTLWNLQPHPGVVISAELRGIIAGRAGTPVRGSGVFVAGPRHESSEGCSADPSDPGRSGSTADDSGSAADARSWLEVSVLETGPIVTDGGIAEGSHDTISGGVFVGYGARVSEVRNRGPVTTYGVNDMVLDNWGAVETWTAQAPLTSHGRSGVGFVNFGVVTALRIQAPVETFGIGARGLNVYRLDGHVRPTVDTVELERITTHGAAAVGIQIGQPIGGLIVHGGIETHGGAGDSLVRGAITRLSAHPLSVQPGGRIGTVEVHGAVISAGSGVAAVEVRGDVGTMRVAAGITARGARADAVRVDGGRLSLHDTQLSAADGVAIRVAPSSVLELRTVAGDGAELDLVVER